PARLHNTLFCGLQLHHCCFFVSPGILPFSASNREASVRILRHISSLVLDALPPFSYSSLRSLRFLAPTLHGQSRTTCGLAQSSLSSWLEAHVLGVQSEADNSRHLFEVRSIGSQSSSVLEEASFQVVTAQMEKCPLNSPKRIGQGRSTLIPRYSTAALWLR